MKERFKTSGQLNIYDAAPKVEGTLNKDGKFTFLRHKSLENIKALVMLPFTSICGGFKGMVKGVMYIKPILLKPVSGVIGFLYGFTKKIVVDGFRGIVGIVGLPVTTVMALFAEDIPSMLNKDKLASVKQGYYKRLCKYKYEKLDDKSPSRDIKSYNRCYNKLQDVIEQNCITEGNILLSQKKETDEEIIAEYVAKINSRNSVVCTKSNCESIQKSEECFM